MQRALLAVAVLALAACGGGGGGRLSASENRSKADAICADANQKLNRLGTPSTADELRSLLKKARPTLKNAVDDLESLDPPQSLESKVNAWNAKNDRLLELYDKLIKETNLLQLQKQAQELGKLNDQANSYARAELGLTDCATG